MRIVVVVRSRNGRGWSTPRHESGRMMMLMLMIQGVRVVRHGIVVVVRVGGWVQCHGRWRRCGQRRMTRGQGRPSLTTTPRWRRSVGWHSMGRLRVLLRLVL